MFGFVTLLLQLLRFALAGVVMFFAFQHGPLIGTVSLLIWFLVEGVASTERVNRWLLEGRPTAGTADAEIYDKMLKLSDKSMGALLMEQFFAIAVIIGVHCLVGWKLDISPGYVVLAVLGASLFTWPYSIFRLRQCVDEVREPEDETPELPEAFINSLEKLAKVSKEYGRPADEIEAIESARGKVNELGVYTKIE